MRIREGDPLEIYTEKDGEVIFKKYSPIGELGDFALTYAETLNKTTGVPTLITDRDSIIAVSGVSKKDFMEKRVSSDIENLMSEKESFKSQGTGEGVSIAEGVDNCSAGVAERASWHLPNLIRYNSAEKRRSSLNQPSS